MYVCQRKSFQISNHRYMEVTSRFLLALTAVVLLTASSCEDDDPFTTSPEELAEQIRRNTPTELPPITTTGENTMGAWIHPQPGSRLNDLEGDSILFVASGVDRPETALATSLDCDAFDNTLYESNQSIGISGQYCRRPEIDDPRRLSFGIEYYQDSLQIFFRYSPIPAGQDKRYWLAPPLNNEAISLDVMNDDRSSKIFSGIFYGTLINRSPPFDTIEISKGRFDVTYGITP